MRWTKLLTEIDNDCEDPNYSNKNINATKYKNVCCKSINNITI